MLRCPHELFGVHCGYPAPPPVLIGDTRNSTTHPLTDALEGHLEIHDKHRIAMPCRSDSSLPDVNRLTHRRTGGNYHEVATVKASGRPIQVGKTSWYTACHLPSLAEHHFL